MPTCSCVAQREQQQQTNWGGRRTAQVSAERLELLSATGSPAACTELWRRKKRRGATGGQAAWKSELKERGGGENGERSQRGEKSFGAGRWSELDEAREDTKEGKCTDKPSLMQGEKWGTVCTKWRRRRRCGREGIWQEVELRGLDWHESEEEEEREGQVDEFDLGRVFLEGGAET